MTNRNQTPANPTRFGYVNRNLIIHRQITGVLSAHSYGHLGNRETYWAGETNLFHLAAPEAVRLINDGKKNAWSLLFRIMNGWRMYLVTFKPMHNAMTYLELERCFQTPSFYYTSSWPNILTGTCQQQKDPPTARIDANHKGLATSSIFLPDVVDTPPFLTN